MLRSTMFAIAVTLTLALGGAGTAAAGLGQGARVEPVAQNCNCAVFFMGHWWCYSC